MMVEKIDIAPQRCDMLVERPLSDALLDRVDGLLDHQVTWQDRLRSGIFEVFDQSQCELFPDNHPWPKARLGDVLVVLIDRVFFLWAQKQHRGERDRLITQFQKSTSEDPRETVLTAIALAKPLETLRSDDPKGWLVLKDIFFAGMTYEEVAHVRDISVQQVRTKRERALAFLRKRLCRPEGIRGAE